MLSCLNLGIFMYDQFSFLGSNVHYQQQTASLPFAQTLNYMGYPENNTYAPNQTAGYKETGAGFQHVYPSLYRDPYYRYPPMYVGEGYSGQPLQMYHDHPAYHSPMYFPPFYMMASRRREM